MSRIIQADVTNGRGEPTTGPASLPSLTGAIGPDDLPQAEVLEIEVAKRAGRRKSQGVLLVALVAIIAAGSLYAMRKARGDLAVGEAAREVEAKIDTVLAKLAQPDLLTADYSLGGPALETLAQDDTSSIVDMINADPSNHQIPIKFVKKNPFLLVRVESAATDFGASPTAGASSTAKRIKSLQQELARYQLQTIMTGHRKVAVVNGTFIETGDRVGPFIVESIDRLAVRLRVGQDRFELTLGD